MYRMVLAEQAHTVMAVPPRDINGGVQSDVIKMSGAQHASVKLGLGVTGGTTTVTVHACDDFVPTTTEAIPFAVYKCETSGGDVTGDRVEVAAAGFATSLADNVFYIIEIDASDLPAGRGKFQVRLSNPGAATFAYVEVTLTGLRRAHVPTPTAIA
jgi:hypothetical protein